MNYIKHLNNSNIQLPADLIVKKDNTIKLRYTGYNLLPTILSDIDNNKKENTLHLKYWTGSLKHLKPVETDYNNMIDILDNLGIKYDLGNDSPRNGLTGNYIKIKYDYRNKYIKAFKKLFDNVRKAYNN